MYSLRFFVLRLARPLLALMILAGVPLLAACNEGSDDDISAEADPEAEADPDPEADPEAGTATPDPGPPDSTVAVVLKEWSVEPSRSRVPAGVIRFLADNGGTEEHELVLFKDGKELGEVEDVAPNTVKEMTVRVERGTYELACLIVETEGGKTEDHYKNGMKASFVVE